MASVWHVVYMREGRVPALKILQYVSYKEKAVFKERWAWSLWNVTAQNTWMAYALCMRTDGLNEETKKL